MTVNTFEKLDIKDRVKFKLERGDFELSVITHTRVGDLLIENLLFILSELQRDYPNDIVLTAKYKEK
jgi:uncharacterized protein YsxB (DUF464 family)